MIHHCVLVGSTVFYLRMILSPKVRSQGDDGSLCYEPFSLNIRGSQVVLSGQSHGLEKLGTTPGTLL